MLTLHAADSDQESVFLQNKERAYSQRLQLYQEAQGRQAQLVEKLQTKVSNDKVNGYEKKKKKRRITFWIRCSSSPTSPGSTVQKEMWRAGGAGSGENVRFREDATVGMFRSKV